MIRTALALLALGLLGLFGYFFVQEPAEQSNADRAKAAAAHVGDTVVDQGAAGLIRARLVTTFGLGATSYLHVHYDDGAVLVYGLVPEGVTAERLAEIVRAAPSVKSVDVQVLLRPAYLDGKATEPAGGGG
ncbi:MAG: BON domain-containing protein [Phycisphaerae bacterium]|jgi:hypothetical protein